MQLLRSFLMTANVFCLGCWVCLAAFAQTSLKPMPAWEIGPTGSTASFRGISSPGDRNVVWICGSKSTVLMSKDGGSGWSDVSPALGELELRSIRAFSAQRAVIASAGTPATIMLTEDAGKTWREVYRHEAKSAFFDSMQFWDDRRGIVVSDPVDGHFLLVETHDGGASWQALSQVNSPIAESAEACFAASNSAVLLGKAGSIWIGTGGSERGFGRVLYRSTEQDKWKAYVTPIPSNQSSGVFSLAHLGNDESQIVIVGGDYRPGQSSPVTSALSHDRGLTWQTSSKQPAAFRSAVLGYSSAESKSQILVAVGPEGSDYSMDGVNWISFSNHGFHALCSAGDQMFATGASGRFARLVLQRDR